MVAHIPNAVSSEKEEQINHSTFTPEFITKIKKVNHLVNMVPFDIKMLSGAIYGPLKAIFKIRSE